MRPGRWRTLRWPPGPARRSAGGSPSIDRTVRPVARSAVGIRGVVHGSLAPLLASDAPALPIGAHPLGDGVRLVQAGPVHAEADPPLPHPAQGARPPGPPNDAAPRP